MWHSERFSTSSIASSIYFSIKDKNFSPYPPKPTNLFLQQATQSLGPNPESRTQLYYPAIVLASIYFTVVGWLHSFSLYIFYFTVICWLHSFAEQTLFGCVFPKNVTGLRNIEWLFVQCRKNKGGEGQQNGSLTFVKYDGKTKVPSMCLEVPDFSIALSF